MISVFLHLTDKEKGCDKCHKKLSSCPLLTMYSVAATLWTRSYTVLMMIMYARQSPLEEVS